MRTFRYLLALGALLAPVSAWAQGACPIGQSQPQVITTATYTLTATNECNFLLFSSPLPVTVTAPAAASLPAHFVVTLTALFSPLTVTTTSTLNNQSAAQSQSVGPYTNLMLSGDGTSNYYLTLAGNYGVQGLVQNSANTQVVAGTNVNTTATAIMPGVAKWSSAAAWPVNTAPPQLTSNLCKQVPPGGGSTPYVWLLFYDYLGLPRYVPTC